MVANQIAAMKARQGDSYDDFAILYRTNAQSRVLEEALSNGGRRDKHGNMRAAIPYRIYGGLSFYQRKEVKDMLAYMRLAVNQKDEEALIRIINTPARGIGDTTVQKMRTAASERNISLFEVAKEPMQTGFIGSAATMKKLIAFATMIEQFSEETRTLNAFEFAKDVASASGLLSAAMLDTTSEGKDRYENLQELINGIQEFVQERSQNAETAQINEFLQEVSLMTDQDRNHADGTPRVTLMTIHAAKGLEFPIVFIAGVEENLLPSAFCDSLRELEEERRLMYVAMTRAEQVCYISYCGQRFRYGTPNPAVESRFIKEINSQFVDEIKTLSTPSWSNSFSRQLREEINSRYNRFVSNGELQRSQSESAETVSGSHKQIQSPFPIGSMVIHDRFGKGKVLDAYSENGNDRIIIKFLTESQPKTLLLKFAKLKPISQ